MHRVWSGRFLPVLLESTKWKQTKSTPTFTYGVWYEYIPTAVKCLLFYYYRLITKLPVINQNQKPCKFVWQVTFLEVRAYSFANRLSRRMAYADRKLSWVTPHSVATDRLISRDRAFFHLDYLHRNLNSLENRKRIFSKYIGTRRAILWSKCPVYYDLSDESILCSVVQPNLEEQVDWMKKR
jgi:hypothetical protein